MTPPMRDLGIKGLVDAVEIGHGGFATVYRAFQPAFDRFVAVKVIDAVRLDDAAALRFERECKAIGRLSGRPNILDVYETGMTESGQPFLVMPFMPEGSLEDALRRTGPFSWREAVEIGRKVAAALDSAHGAGVLHLDVKPANILRSHDGDPKLADFGIARLTSAARTNLTGMAFSPEYAPPEMMRGEAPTVVADVYSLAATMFALVAGRPAFVERPDDDRFLVMHRTATEPVPDLLRPRGVPEPVSRAITHAMAKDAGDRPASPAEFAATLRAATAPAGTTVDTRRAGGGTGNDGVPSPQGRHAPRALLLLLVGLALIAAWVPASLALDDPVQTSPIIIAGVGFGVAAQLSHLRASVRASE